jgi:hypothetical protein
MITSLRSDFEVSLWDTFNSSQVDPIVIPGGCLRVLDRAKATWFDEQGLNVAYVCDDGRCNGEVVRHRYGDWSATEHFRFKDGHPIGETTVGTVRYATQPEIISIDHPSGYKSSVRVVGFKPDTDHIRFVGNRLVCGGHSGRFAAFRIRNA